jgi:hypothetical protein
MLCMLVVMTKGDLVTGLGFVLFIVDIDCNDCYLYIYRNQKRVKTMIIGGYTMDDQGVHGLTVTENEAGWSFYMQGDDASIFKHEWALWQLRTDDSFEDFLYAHDYNTLFQ